MTVCSWALQVVTLSATSTGRESVFSKRSEIALETVRHPNGYAPDDKSTGLTRELPSRMVCGAGFSEPGSSTLPPARPRVRSEEGSALRCSA
jgi:hypothetical protein